MVKLYSIDDEEKNNKNRVNQVNNHKIFLFKNFKNIYFCRLNQYTLRICLYQKPNLLIKITKFYVADLGNTSLVLI
jgi:hypothetical protein